MLPVAQLQRSALSILSAIENSGRQIQWHQRIFKQPPEPVTLLIAQHRFKFEKMCFPPASIEDTQWYESYKQQYQKLEIILEKYNNLREEDVAGMKADAYIIRQHEIIEEFLEYERSRPVGVTILQYLHVHVLHITEKLGACVIADFDMDLVGKVKALKIFQDSQALQARIDALMQSKIFTGIVAKLSGLAKPLEELIARSAHASCQYSSELKLQIRQAAEQSLELQKKLFEVIYQTVLTQKSVDELVQQAGIIELSEQFGTQLASLDRRVSFLIGDTEEASEGISLPYNILVAAKCQRQFAMASRDPEAKPQRDFIRGHFNKFLLTQVLGNNGFYLVAWHNDPKALEVRFGAEACQEIGRLYEFVQTYLGLYDDYLYQMQEDPSKCEALATQIKVQDDEVRKLLDSYPNLFFYRGPAVDARLHAERRGKLLQPFTIAEWRSIAKSKTYRLAGEAYTELQSLLAMFDAKFDIDYASDSPKQIRDKIKKYFPSTCVSDNGKQVENIYHHYLALRKLDEPGKALWDAYSCFYGPDCSMSNANKRDFLERYRADIRLLGMGLLQSLPKKSYDGEVGSFFMERMTLLSEGSKRNFFARESVPNFARQFTELCERCEKEYGSNEYDLENIERSHRAETKRILAEIECHLKKNQADLAKMERLMTSSKEIFAFYDKTASRHEPLTQSIRSKLMEAKQRKLRVIQQLEGAKRNIYRYFNENVATTSCTMQVRSQ